MLEGARKKRSFGRGRLRISRYLNSRTIGSAMVHSSKGIRRALGGGGEEVRKRLMMVSKASSVGAIGIVQASEKSRHVRRGSLLELPFRS